MKLSKIYSNITFSNDIDKTPEEVDLTSTECESEEEKEEEIDVTEKFRSNFHSQKYETILKYTYYFLSYCCLLESRFQDVVKFTGVLKRDFDPNPEMRFNLALYQTEALLSLGDGVEALKTLQSVHPNELSLQHTKYENSLTGLEEPEELTPTVIMFLNMASLNFLTDNFDEAESCIQNALSTTQFGNSDALAYSLIYLNLRWGEQETALKILKKRRVDASSQDEELKICY